MILVNGRPDDLSNREEKEVRVYDLLDKLGIEYKRVDHEKANNMEACEEIDKILEAAICKNLFLCNTQKTKFYLLMILSHKMFKTKDITKQIGSARLSFAPNEFMEEYLDILPGSVSVLGLMNDKYNKVQLLMDKDLLNSEYFGCHPCVNTSSLKIRTKDLMEKILPSINHSPIMVEL